TLQGARPKLADFCSATMAEFYSAVDKTLPFLFCSTQLSRFASHFPNVGTAKCFAFWERLPPSSRLLTKKLGATTWKP
ncbi:hypothetical protein, partial [Phaeobacter italicus]|uniref:hypothetical protein n=1 Tax=Phaeobacter italicus TaxID=481446 RepID=UPI00248E3307